MKNIEIIQQAGLGDVMFIQKLCKVLNETHTVHHRIAPNIWNAGARELITPVKCGPDIDNRNSDQDDLIYNCSSLWDGKTYEEIMTSKYSKAAIDWRDWADYLEFNQNKTRQNTLKEKFSSNLFDIDWSMPYIFVNEHYAFRKKHLGVRKYLPNDYDGNIIFMNYWPEFTLFDWIPIIEKAEEIHTVDTSVYLLIEKLDMKANKLVCHPRHYTRTEKCLSHLSKLPWQWSKYTREEWEMLVPMEKE